MKTGMFGTKTMVLEAYERLKIWFDPAMNGSPYELLSAQNKQKNKKRFPFIPRKLSMRV